MKDIRVILAALAAFALLLQVSCETSSEGSQNKDSISITAISTNNPVAMTNSVVATNVPGNIYVTVEYKLETADYGDLDVGFNNGADPSWYTLASNSTEIIEAGDGEHTFEITISPTNWLTQAEHKAYVSLSIPKHSVPWTPLADDMKGFNFDE